MEEVAPEFGFVARVLNRPGEVYNTNDNQTATVPDGYLHIQIDTNGQPVDKFWKKVNELAPPPYKK